MEQMFDQLITVGAGLGILAGAWFIWFISGVANNLFSPKKWSWRRTFEDIVKTVIMGVGILSWVVLMNVIDWYTRNLGADISSILDGATVVGLLAVIIGGSANYAAKAYRNFIGFIGTSHTAEMPGEQNYHAVAQDVIENVATLYNSINAQQESPEAVAGQVLTKKETAKLAELGAIPYVKYDVSTPQAAYNNLISKGFNEGWGYQCVAGFKEFMFCLCGRYVAAGGAASGYASEPARSAVCKLGFTWHSGSAGLQDGDWGIWTNGLYGHVAMYYQGRWLGQNQAAADGNVGNPFNLLGLPMTGFTGYFRPNIYAKSASGQYPDTNPTNSNAATSVRPLTSGQYPDIVEYTYQRGDTFGAVIQKLGLQTSHGLWGADGDVAFYTAQLNAQGITGNIPIGATIRLTRRK